MSIAALCSFGQQRVMVFNNSMLDRRRYKEGEGDSWKADEVEVWQHVMKKKVVRFECNKKPQQ